MVRGLPPPPQVCSVTSFQPASIMMLNSGYDFRLRWTAFVPLCRTQRQHNEIQVTSSPRCARTLAFSGQPPCSSARVATESVLTTPWVRGVAVLGAGQLPVMKPPGQIHVEPAWRSSVTLRLLAGAVLLALWFHARAKEIPAESRNGRVMLFLYHHCPRGPMTLEDARARSIIGAASARVGSGHLRLHYRVIDRCPIGQCQ